MNAHDILCVALYEAKLLSRRKEFHLFVFFSLVGITVCHVFWLKDTENWKIMALPCSLPLVNAYMFSVLQSLFAMLFVTDFPRREPMYGALESIFSRPVNNSDYTLGKIVGEMILVGMVNGMVILLCLFFLHLGSIVPYQFGYYLFYFFTLNLPSLVFVMGISLWLIRILKVRLLVMFLLLVLLVLSVIWLPYRFHGTFDFLGSGLPNLFSDVTGHVGLTNYLLHRLGYFLLGLGFLLLSIHGMKRIPNNLSRVKRWSGAGVFFILIAIVCGVFIEVGYLPAREARASYRDSFCGYWDEACGSVTRHHIVVQQEGEVLSVESELMLYNPNAGNLEKLILFLNPGLHVESLELSGNKMEFYRENQVVVVDYSLKTKDSVCLRLRYKGEIDECFTDLHLCDDAYEDSFRGDQFFPTGRRSAFVGDDFILLTPACVWYPVAVPPVNPVVPAYSGRDFTKFQVRVVRPRQKILCSQGEAIREKDTCRFEPSRSLAGVSLCGGDYELRERRTPDLAIRLYTFKKHFSPFRGLPVVNGKIIHSCLNDKINYQEIPYRWSDMDWYEEKTGNLFFMETPLPFITDARAGRERTGYVEPGMVFFPERGFDLGLKSTFMGNWDEDKAEIMFARFLGTLSTYNAFRSSHPLLGLGNSRYYRRQSPYPVLSLLKEPDLWIKSEEYPFVGYLFNRICLERKEFSKASVYFGANNQWVNKTEFYLAGRSLFSIMSDNRVEQNVLHDVFVLKSRELLDRILLNVSADSFYSVLTDMFTSRHGIVSLDTFSREMNEHLGGNPEWKSILSDWLHTDHSQFFKVKDMYVYYYPSRKKGQEIVPGYHSHTGWVEIKGEVMNRGKSGGAVAVEFESGSLGRAEGKRYVCYLNPGEAKSFHLVGEGVRGFVQAVLNTGLSSNRPQLFYFEARNKEENEHLKPLAGAWVDMDVSAFSPPEGEIIVDNSDAGFSLKNAKETWLQRWFKKTSESRGISGEIPSCWESSIDPFFYGDSVRSCYFKGFGDGNSTATWCVNLNEGGKYRVSAQVARLPITGFSRRNPGVIYSYTIKHAGGEEQIAVELDRFFELTQVCGWVTLGEFDFPAGEVSVTLSDYDEQGRDYIAVIADVVKWQKLDN